MTEKIKTLLENLKSKEYRKLRVTGKTFSTENAYTYENCVKFFRELADIEKPMLFENDSFGFNRYTDFKVPQRSGNVTPNYHRIITNGFDKIVADIKISIQKTDDEEKQKFGKMMLGFLEICFEICEEYKNCAKERGNTRLYKALLRIPHSGATSFYEARKYKHYSRSDTANV